MRLKFFMYLKISDEQITMNMSNAPVTAELRIRFVNMCDAANYRTDHSCL